MTREEIERVIFDALELCNQSRSDDEAVPVTTDVALFGPDGHLDSMALVGLLLDIEDTLLDRGIELSLSDERAMSESRSPFRNVATLTDYIERRLGEG